eukprot:scaffold434_cov186-Pinguiococcus_pyrenoidosus.AAC.138
MRASLLISVLVALVAGASAFVAAPRALPTHRTAPIIASRGSNLHMGGKVSDAGLLNRFAGAF